jgi:hypothetical protein
MAHDIAETIVKMADMMVEDDKRNADNIVRKRFMEKCMKNAYLITAQYKMGETITPKYGFYTFVVDGEIYVEARSKNHIPTSVAKCDGTIDLDYYIDGRLNNDDMMNEDEYDEDTSIDIALYSVEFGNFECDCEEEDCDRKFVKKTWIYNTRLGGYDSITKPVKNMMNFVKNIVVF